MCGVEIGAIVAQLQFQVKLAVDHPPGDPLLCWGSRFRCREIAMENFTFQNKTKIIFGKGTETEVGKETARHAKKVLLHYGGGSIKASGLYDRVGKSLRAAGVDFVELGGVKPNPRLSLVREGIAICREKKCELVLAVGGGSVIDSAKAIALGVLYSGDVWDFYTGKAPATESMPVAVVLTIPAAGSESSNNSVITNEQGMLKKAVGTECIRPVFDIMNPELTFSLPPFQTASGAADIMAHVMERYFTRVTEVDFTDRLCEATLHTIIDNVPVALAKPDNYDARAQIMWASTIAHNDLLGTGRVADWASHRIEHELSGIYDVTHGAGLAVVFPAWMKYVYKNDVSRFARFATRVWGVEPRFDWPERTALEGIGRTKSFFRDIGLPTSLKELGVMDDRLEEMARKATAAGPLGSFTKLGVRDVVSIYQLAQ
jgi:alcohol dehydrogenase